MTHSILSVRGVEMSDRQRRLRKKRGGHGASPLSKPLLSIQEQEPVEASSPAKVPSQQQATFIQNGDGGMEKEGAGTEGSSVQSTNRYDIASRRTGAKLKRYV